MSVIELGTYHVRSGYAGDATCTRSVRALRTAAAPEEVDFFSILYAASRGLEDEGGISGISADLTRNAGQASGSSTPDPDTASEALLPLWSLRQLEAHPDVHMDSLRRMKREVLECAETDPLCLVLPEVWHERHDVMEALFELSLETPGLTTALYAMRPSVSWAFSAGLASALVLDVGHSHSTVTAVVDGYALRNSIDTVPIGGDVVTAQYAELLKRQRPAVVAAAASLSSEAAREVYWQDWVADVKHHFARVMPRAMTGAMTGPAAKTVNTRSTASVDLQAPDGSRVHIEEQKAAAPFEVFFCATAHGHGGVAAMLAACKQRMDPEMQLQKVPHLLAGGGAAGVAGFRDRLREELLKLDAAYFRYSKDGVVQVSGSEDGAWAGASLAASSSSFTQMWVTRGEWAEEGPSVLHRKLL